MSGWPERRHGEQVVLGAKLMASAMCDFAHVFMPTSKGGEWVLIELPPMDDDLRRPPSGVGKDGR